MDTARATHDEVFLHLDQPRLVHLSDDVRKLGHHARIVDAAEDAPNEKTPLVVKAGKQLVVVDADVDLEALDQQLRQEELLATQLDHSVPIAQLWRQEAAGLGWLSIPITLAVVLEVFPPILMSILIGQVSGDASPQVLASSSLSDFFQGQVTISVTTGLGAAVATTCAQSFGAQQHRQLWLYAQAGLLACLYCLPVLALVCLNSAWLLTLLGQDPVLARVAQTLITIALVALPFSLVYTVARAALQAQNIATPFVVASVAAYSIGFPIGYYLGNHTSLGYIGIALSMIISQLLRALSVVPILLRNEIFIASWPGWQWREAHQLARRLWPISAGSVLMATFMTAGFNTIILLCGYLPNATTVMAANNIASALISLSFIPMMGLNAGGTVRIGNALGAGQPRRASVAALVVFVETITISIACVAFCWCIATSYAEDYTSDAATIALATSLVRFLVVLVPLVAFVFSAQAVFQACSAQWLCAMLNFMFLFVMGVPLGLMVALPLGAGVFGLWIGNISGAIVFSLVAAVWISRLDWRKTAHDARNSAHLHVERESETEVSYSSFSQ